jgi:exonuclease SbcC
MIRRLILTDFMAHARTELTLGPGLTVICGPNNTGKSAVVEALRCLAENPSHRLCIRHGAKEARVEAEVDDGTRVVWIRKEKTAGYEIHRPGATEPERYWKLKRQVPEAVAEVLRLDLVDLETGELIDVHIGNQREPVFLLNKPPTAVAAFLAASSEAAHLVGMQKLLAGRTLDARRRQKELSSRQAAVARELAAFAPLPGLALELEEAAGEEDAVAASTAALSPLSEAAGRLRDLGRLLTLRRREREALATLRPVPALADAPALAGLLVRRTQLAAELIAGEKRREVLAALDRPPELFPAGDLRALVREIGRTRRRLAGSTRTDGALAALAAPPALAPVEPLARQLATRAELTARLAAARRTAHTLAGLTPPPSPADLSGLRQASARLRELGRRLDAARVTLSEADARIEAARRETEAALAEAGSCPLCGAELTAADFLDGVHRHEPA